jgi:hypothetical protein
MLAKRDVYLDVISCRQRPGVFQIAGVTIGVLLSIFPVERERNPRRALKRRVDGFKSGDNLFEADRIDQRKIKILRESVVTEITSPQGRSTLESENCL